MSYSIFVLGFRDEDPIGLPEDVFHRILGPFAVVDERGFGSLTLPGTFAAELYSHRRGDDWAGFDLTRFPWEVLDLVATFMVEADAVTFLPGGIALITREGKRADLPGEFQARAVVVRTGRDVADAIEQPI